MNTKSVAQRGRSLPKSTRAILLLAALPLLAVPACSSMTSSDSSSAPAPNVEEFADAPDQSGALSGTQSLDEAGSPYAAKAADDQVSERDVVRTASVSVVVDDLVAQSRSVESVAKSADGYVSSVSTTGATGGSQIDAVAVQPLPVTAQPTSGLVAFTLRVPAKQYDAVMEQLQNLGEVRSLAAEAQDVTEKTQDLAARISAQRESVQRVRLLMDQAKTLNEIVRVEQELAQRQGDLESMVAQQRRIGDQVAMATISVALFDRAAAADIPGDSHWWDDAWKAFTSTWNALFIALAVFAPILIVIGLGIAIALRMRRRKNPSVSDVSETSGDSAISDDSDPSTVKTPV